MKVFVQIPCFNEEATLPAVLSSIPKHIKGVELEILVIDDGSTDRTVEVARAHGVKHIISRPNRGLARTFRDGVDYALEHGADIVVNTDGDNQYPQSKIPELIQPILDGKAEIVVADRQTRTIAHFSPFKKLLQRFGSWVVNQAGGTTLPDAASGFRAYSKRSLLQLNILTRFSYCMETIIQAGNKGLAITSIPVVTNAKTRESRLFKNTWQHVRQSGFAIVRAFIMYKPYAFFVTFGSVFFVSGMALFVRYLYFFLAYRNPGEHLQSLLIGAVLLIGAFLSAALAIIADLMRTNRILLEESLEQERMLRYGR